MMKNDDELLTVREVSKQMHVDVTTVRRWIAGGLLRAARLPHQGKRQEYRIQRAELERWMSVKRKWKRVKVE